MYRHITNTQCLWLLSHAYSTISLVFQVHVLYIFIRIRAYFGQHLKSHHCLQRLRTRRELRRWHLLFRYRHPCFQGLGSCRYPGSLELIDPPEICYQTG